MITFAVLLGFHLASRSLGHGFVSASKSGSSLMELREGGPVSAWARLASPLRRNMESVLE